MNEVPGELRAPAPAWERTDGHLPVVLHVPHAATWIPDDERAAFVLDDAALAREVTLMTDHRTDALAAAALEAGAYGFVNRVSRLVCDPERFPDEREPMERAGMGFAYTRTADGRRLREVGDEDRERIRKRWFAPYTDAFANLVREVFDAHGTCLILDVHSYPAQRLPYERGGHARPDVCLGTDERHSPGPVRAAAIETCERLGLWWDLNTPFEGTYVPAWALGTERKVASLMVEVRRDVYLDESTLELDEGGAYVVGELLRQLTAGLEMDTVQLPAG